MTLLGPYQVHPIADVYPLIDGDEFKELIDDVRKNGLLNPIVLNHDKTMLIDGRNRYRACMESMVDPVFDTLPERYTDEMIVDFITSANLQRRHLNAGQRATVALAYEEYFAEKAKEQETLRKIEAPRNQFTTNSSATVADLPQSQTEHERKSRERAAKVVGASGRAVQQAKALKKNAPDLLDQVRSGGVALDNAYRQHRQRERVAPKPEREAPTQVMLTLRTHKGDEVQYPQPKSKATFNETPGDGISWASWSWNPVTGCLHGCDYCYARELANKPSYAAAYPVGFTPLFHEERLDAPANTTIPAAHRDDPAYRRVFVCSMADLYGRWVPDEWIEKVHGSMLASPLWQYILLTKFPSRYVGLDLPPGAWVGTSVDEQKRVRIAEDAFREIDGVTVKWLSLEPLREPLEFTDLSMFDWVVIGAQTETRQPNGVMKSFAPPFEWVARIVAQAREAGCAVHLKPNLLGSTSPQLPGMGLPNEYPDGTA